MGGIKSIVAGACLSAMTLAVPAAATTIGFEDASTGTLTAPLPTSYKGLNWYNFYTMDPYAFQQKYYVNGWVGAAYQDVNASPTTVYNGYGKLAYIASDDAFTLNSMVLWNAWRVGLNAEFTGYNANGIAYQQTVTTNWYEPKRYTFDWTGLTLLVVRTFGGYDNMFRNDGTQFIMDDVRVNEPLTPPPTLVAQLAPSVPEPQSWALVITGITLVGGALRQRRRVALRTA